MDSLLIQLTAAPKVRLSDIARAAGCSLSFVSSCAHGQKKPTRKVRDAAERLLGHPADELFPVWPAS
jgi:hypothetical protein